MKVLVLGATGGTGRLIVRFRLGDLNLSSPLTPTLEQHTEIRLRRQLPRGRPTGSTLTLVE